MTQPHNRRFVTEAALAGDTTLGSVVDAYLNAHGLGTLNVNPGSLTLTGTTGSYAATPETTALDITGDLDVRWYGTLTSLNTGAFQTLVAKRGGTTISWSFRENTTGKLQLLGSANGTSVVTASASVNTPTGSGYRATWRASDGRVQFFYADTAGSVVLGDGSKWTQLGTDQTLAIVSLAVTADPISIGGLGNGTNATACVVSKVEVRAGLDGTMKASPDFTIQESGSPFTDTQGNVWTVYNGTLTLLTASVTRNGATKSISSPTEVAGSIRSYRGVPYKDPHTGYYLPRGFGSLTNETTTQAAIQAAMDAANADGGGTVLLDEAYTVGPHPTLTHAALITRRNVHLKGLGRFSGSSVKLVSGANVHLLAGSRALELADPTKEDATTWFQVSDLTLDGNKAGQDGSRTHDVLHAVRHPYLDLLRVRLTNGDRHGYFSTGQSEVGVSGTQVTRPLWVNDVVADNNDGFGFYSSATNREFHGTGLHAEGNGRVGDNEGGGFFLDHSEDMVNQLTARNNHGDGFYIHNVQLCHYDNLHSFGNAGIGIYVEAMVNSLGRGWVAAMNCTALFAASYRSENTASAEVYFDAQVSSYGATQQSRIDGIIAPGKKDFGGNLADNRHADWSVYIENGVAASLDLQGLIYGDGGLVGTLHDLR